MAFYYERSLRVRLDVDLTSYHGHLVRGVEGLLIPDAKCSVWGSQDRFGAVRFDCCGAMLDVMLESVTILDEEFVRTEERLRAEWLSSLERAGDVVLHLGPGGGLRNLSFRTGNRHYSIGDKAKAEECLTIFAKHEIQVREVREPRVPRPPSGRLR